MRLLTETLLSLFDNFSINKCVNINIYTSLKNAYVAILECYVVEQIAISTAPDWQTDDHIYPGTTQARTVIIHI